MNTRGGFALVRLVSFEQRNVYASLVYSDADIIFFHQSSVISDDSIIAVTMQACSRRLSCYHSCSAGDDDDGNRNGNDVHSIYIYIYSLGFHYLD